MARSRGRDPHRQYSSSSKIHSCTSSCRSRSSIARNASPQLRTAGAPEALAPAAQKEIHGLNPDLPVFDVRSMEHVLGGPNGFFLLQLAAAFGGGLGALGLVLALVGIYGVVSFAATQRTQEIGVRMALGAQRGDIMRLVVGHGLRLVAAGIAIGARRITWAVAPDDESSVRNLLHGSRNLHRGSLNPRHDGRSCVLHPRVPRHATRSLSGVTQ